MAENASKTASKTATKSAASKPAASKTASPTPKPGDTSTPTSQGNIQSPVANTGPQTGTAPPPEADTAGARPPSATLDRSGATPLEAPDASGQVEPVLGHNESSTNSVAANAAVRSTPGEDHVSLQDEKGKAVKADSLFDGPDGPQTYVTVKQSVYEEFLYPGSKRTTTRLLWPKGARVDVREAERFKAAHKVHADNS